MGLYQQFKQWVGWGLNTTPVNTGNGIMYINNDLVTWGNDPIENGYSVNDLVYTAVNLIIRKIKVAPWGLYKIVDESSLKRLKAMQIDAKSYTAKDIAVMQRKAIEPFEGGHKLKEQLEYPNDYESFNELVANFCAYEIMIGNGVLYAVLLNGGANSGKPQEYHVLASNMVKIKVANSFPNKVVGFQYTAYGQPIELTREEIMHNKYFNPNIRVPGGQMWGMSPFQALSRVTTRSNSGLQASTMSYQNGGPEAVLYTDDPRMTGEQSYEQAQALKERLKEFEGVNNKKKLATSGYKVGVAQIGISPVDMGILDSEKWDMRRICAVLQVPSELANDPDNKTHANREEAKKSLTLDAVLPPLTAFRNSFNRKIQTDWGYAGQNLFVDFDMGIYSELQDDQSKLVGWLKDAWWIPAKLKYDIQNMDIPEYLDEAILEKLFVPNNLVDITTLDPAVMDQQMNIIDTQMQGNGQTNGIMQNQLQ